MLLSAAALSFSANITYQEDVTNFPNPERGFYITTIAASALQNARNSQGITLVRKYYQIDAYVNSALPQSVLDNITSDAAILRAAGAKMVPRFAYNSGECSDAPLSRILSHIDQLTPVLRANSDVIAFFEAGFIGRWGEWHHWQCTDPNNLDNTAARQAVLFRLLDAVPDRMVALRYNLLKRDIFGTSVPLGPDSAFSGSNRARTGAHNDCFRADATDAGTYQGSQTVEWQKTFLNQDNRYVAQGGESCGSSSYSGCDSAAADLRRMHWDAINSEYESSVLASWTSGGCMPSIQKLLGYRLKLISAQLQDAVRPGSFFTGTINVINIGWGKIYNHRGCELVFRNTATKSKFIVRLANDPRRWCMTDSAVAVTVSALIPGTAPEGSYAVYLNLPDTASRLYGKSAYSIRLANTGVWEDSTGYNSLLHTAAVSMSAPVRFPGFFQKASEASGASGLPFSLLKKKRGARPAYVLTFQSDDAGPAGIEIFTLKGERLVCRQINRGPDNRFCFSWNSPSGYLFLLRIRQGNHDWKGYVIF